MRLKDQVAIITGAADGIGRATAVKFAQEGADVLLVDLNEVGMREAAGLARGHGRRAAVLAVDVGEPGAPHAIVQQAVEELGGLDILVNNAGLSDGGPLLQLEDAVLDRVLRVNLIAPFLLMQAAARYWISEGRGGRIVSTSSINARIVQGDSAPYCASKGGVRMLTKGAALDLGPHGITVNAVGPGHTRTGMTKHLMETPGLEEAWAAKTALGRIGEPEDIANAIAFLASEEAAYVTGQTLYVEGGRTLHAP